MMDENNSIILDNVTKEYTIQVYNESNKKEKIIKTILSNISITVPKGEVLGIIGRNGSGKSTLLKIISKIIKPTKGTVKYNGKIASILELGMGFHPDMTGKENILLKGEMYGFSRKELLTKLDKIIKYADLGEYINNPLRTYSSGMVGRLAFAIMVNVDADILIVDEVLSIGDLSFSTKANQHFKTLSKSGKTIIVVSHNFSTLEQMCSKIIWIENGKIIENGLPSQVIAKYKNKTMESPDILKDLSDSGVPEAQYKIAQMYKNGEYLDKDDNLWLQLIEKSANQGFVPAQIQYAEYLENNRRLDEARFYLQMAADKGDEYARRKVAIAHYGTTDDEESKLLTLYQRLANECDPQNEHRYAELLMKLSKNNEEKKNAFNWYKKAADDGNANAMVDVAALYRDGIGTLKSNEKMIEYLDKASNVGFMKAIMMLAEYYQYGGRIEKNDEMAFHYYYMAAKMGNSKAQYTIAIMYKTGIGVSQNELESIKWFKTYSKSVYSAYQVLGSEYIKNYPEILQIAPEDLYRSASEQFNLTANFLKSLSEEEGSENWISNIETAAQGYNIYKRVLADHYYKQNINPSQMIDLYKVSASIGDNMAQYRLGIIYMEGIFVKKDLTKSKQYLIASAIRGNADAIKILTDNSFNVT